MVGQMTYGKRQWEKYDSQMRRIIPIMHETMKELISVIDADTYAFNDYMVSLLMYFMYLLFMQNQREFFIYKLLKKENCI